MIITVNYCHCTASSFIHDHKALPIRKSRKSTSKNIDAGKPMAYVCAMNETPPVTVIETPSFLRDAKRLMDEDEQLDLVSFLAHNPTAGVKQ